MHVIFGKIFDEDKNSSFSSMIAYLTLSRQVWIGCTFFVSGYRSNNFIVGLTDVSPASTTPTLWNYDVCARYPGVVGDGATVHLNCTSCMPPRRYLIVQVETANEVLNFCEIQVYIRGRPK